MSVTTHCLVTVEYSDGAIRIRHWEGARGAKQLRDAIRRRYSADPTIKHYMLGNTWTVNSYGAH